MPYHSLYRNPCMSRNCILPELTSTSLKLLLPTLTFLGIHLLPYHSQHRHPFPPHWHPTFSVLLTDKCLCLKYFCLCHQAFQVLHFHPHLLVSHQLAKNCNSSTAPNQAVADWSVYGSDGHGIPNSSPTDSTFFNPIKCSNHPRCPYTIPLVTHQVEHRGSSMSLQEATL